MGIRASSQRCDFWNQRNHSLLNRFEVLATLQRLAGADVVEGLDPEDEKLESFLEREFFARLTAAGLPLPTLLVVRVIGGHRVIRVDCEYRDPNVSIFLDGRAWHAQSVEKIEDDLAVRNSLEDKGVRVLECTYHDVMDRFDEVADEIRAALEEPTRISADLAFIEGLNIQHEDPAAHRAVVRVDPASWVCSEEARAVSLHAANRARLCGWHLHRLPAEAASTSG
jgi:hypothetical protein